MGRAAAALLAALIACAACRASEGQRTNTTAAPTASSSPPTSSSPPSPATATAATPRAVDTWFVGTWTGTYQSSAHHIDLPPGQGGLPEWKVETKTGTGNGTLSFVAAADGTATGSAEGPLGKQEIRGAFEDAQFAARLIATSHGPNVFQGTVTLRRDGERITGQLQASSSDGRNSRSGAVTLTKSAR